MLMSRVSLDSMSPIECQEGELFKLTFGNDRGVNDSYRYFSQDVGSQTEEKDVMQIIELSAALKTLTLENVELKRTLNLTKSSLQSDFYRRLTNASNQLYSRMNQRLDDVEESQRDRVEVVRRAFRTQLSDALSQMAALYSEKMKRKLNNDRSFIESEQLGKYTKKIADLTAKLRKYEIKIKELERSITDLQENEMEIQPTMILDSESEMSEKIVEDDNISLVMSEVEEDTVREDEIKQREYIEELVKRIETLEKQNNVYQKDVKKFENELDKLTAELDSSQGVIDVLRSEKGLLEEKMNKNDEQYSRRILDLEMEVVACKEKYVEKENEKENEPVTPEVEIKEKPFTISVDIQKNHKEFPDMSGQVASLKRSVKEMAEKELQLNNEVFNLQSKSGNESKGYIEQIKVLESINTKLRNEMFTRQRLQSDFKTLHSASVKYARNNQPIGILPSQSNEKETVNRSTHDSTLPAVNSHPQVPEIDQAWLSNFVEMNIN